MSLPSPHGHGRTNTFTVLADEAATNARYSAVTFEDEEEKNSTSINGDVTEEPTTTAPARGQIQLQIDQSMIKMFDKHGILPCNAEGALREKRAMLDLELRLMLGQAKGIHEQHQLHLTPHYSRSLHMLSDAPPAASPSSSSTSTYAANATGGYRAVEKPIESLPLLTKLDSEDHVRQKVQQRMEEIVQVQNEPSLHFALDTFLAECTSAGTLRNDSWSTLHLLLQFQSHYLSSLEILNYQLVTRFMKYGGNNSTLERYGTRFSNILVAINKQYEKILQRYEVLQKTYLENITDEPVPTVTSNSSAASTASSSTPLPPNAPKPPRKRFGWERSIIRADLEDYFRYALPRIQTRMKNSRFLLKLKWLHGLYERDLIDTSVGGLWHRSKDLSEPPFFKSPRPCDVLPCNLAKIDEVEDENQRLRQCWMKESGMSGEDDPMEDERRHDHPSAISLNPFMDVFTTTPSKILYRDPAKTTDPEEENRFTTSNSSNSYTFTAPPSSIFYSISRTFPRVFAIQNETLPSRYQPYSILLNEEDELEKGLLDEEYSSMSESEIAHTKSMRSKREMELRRQEIARLKQKKREAEEMALNQDTGAPSASSSTAAQQQQHQLRDSTQPVISSSGKIWGGKAMNNFRIRDEKEVEAVLANAEAAQGGLVAVANEPSKPPSKALKDGISVGGSLIAREDDSAKIPDQPFKSFTFSNQKQADMFSDPARMIQSLGHAGGIDKKRVGPKVYIRKATFLRHTRMYANVPDYLVTQKQILSDHSASTNIDQQLLQHFNFVVKNDRIEVFNHQLTRLVAEHLRLLESPSTDPNSSSPSTTANAASTSEPDFTVTSSLIVDIEIPEHKLQSLYMLRVLRIRELRGRILGVLNYFRSMQKTLVKDELLYHKRIQHSGLNDDQPRAQTHPKRAPGATLPTTPPSQTSPAASATANLYQSHDILARTSTCAILEDRSDEWSFDTSLNGSGSASNDHILVRDARKKVRIVYDAAINDLDQLERELLGLASIYIERHQYVGMGMKGEADHELAAYQNLLNSLDGSIANPTTNLHSGKYSTRTKEGGESGSMSGEDGQFYPDSLLISSRNSKFPVSADRWSVLLDLYEREYQFLKSKRGLMDIFFEAYTHTIDQEKLRGLAQKMINLMIYRPHFDLDRSVSSFVGIYSAETLYLSSQTALFREVMYGQLEEEILCGGISVGVNPMNTGQGNSSGGAAGSSVSSSASGNATFDWSLFSEEFSNNPYDVLNSLSAMHITPGLPHPLQHPHTLFQVHQTFDILDDVANMFEDVCEKIEATLPVSKQKVLNIYLMQIRQKVVDNALHCYRSHVHEDAPFPPSQHYTTLDFFESSPFFTNVSYAAVKLNANWMLLRESMTGSTRRHPIYSEDGNIVDGSELQIYLNYVELLNLRSHILHSMYESVLLTRLYFQQGEKLGIESPRTMLDMHSSSFSLTAAATAAVSNKSVFSSFASPGVTGSSYLLSSGTGEVGSFAISEIFSFLPKDLFKKLQELERLDVLLDSNILQHLRSLYEVQVMQGTILACVLQIHSTLANAEEVPEQMKKMTLDQIAPQIKKLFRDHDTAPGSHNKKSIGGGSDTSRTMPNPGQRLAKNPFLKMIANITAEAGANSSDAAAKKPKRPGAVQATKLRSPILRLSEPYQRGCFSSETFVDIYHVKYYARQQLDEYLNQPISPEEQLARRKQSLIGGIGIASHHIQTHGSVLSSKDLIHSYVTSVLKSFAPELYFIDLSYLLNQFRDLHATGRFGTFSPFMSLKFKISSSSSDGFLEHLLYKQSVPAHPQRTASMDGTVRSGVNPASTTATTTEPVATPAPAPTPAPVGIILPDGSTLLPASVRWGGGSGSSSSVPNSPPTRPSFTNLFQMPTVFGLSILLRLERGALPIENLRYDALCRRHLYDSTLLSISLAQLEYLPSLTFAANKIAESTSSRMDFIRNELHEMSQGILTSANPNGSSVMETDTLEDVFAMITSERRILWLRLLSFLRTLTEALLIREDILGLEYVWKVLRIVRHEYVPTSGRHGSQQVESMFDVNSFNPKTDAVIPFSSNLYEGLSSAAMRLFDSFLLRPQPWVGSHASSMFNAFHHPTTPLHRLASYFLFWCDKRVLSSFEGLSREHAQMNKLVYRMSKIEMSTPVAPTEEPTANASTTNTTVVTTSASRLRAARTVNLMRHALGLAQMFDAFYLFALELENDALKGISHNPIGAASSSNKNKASSAKFASSASPVIMSWWSHATHASLANPHVDMFVSSSSYLRVLEIADYNLVSKVNELRRKESVRTLRTTAVVSGTTSATTAATLPASFFVPLAFLSILERTSNQSAILMSAATAVDHEPTSLYMQHLDALHEAGIVSSVAALQPPVIDKSSSSEKAISTATLPPPPPPLVGGVNSNTMFGFTLFALSLRQQDQELFMTLLRDQFSFDLFAKCIMKLKHQLDQLESEEQVRSQPGEYGHELKYASILQSTRLLINEIQDTSYEMNVIKEWLSSGGRVSNSSGLLATPSAATEATSPMASPSSSSSTLTLGSSSQKHKLYYVLSKNGFNSLLSQLLRELMKFGDESSAYRLQVLNNINQFFVGRLGEKDGLLNELGRQLNDQVKEYTAQSLAHVTDAQYKLIIDYQQGKEELEHLIAFGSPANATLQPPLIASDSDDKSSSTSSLSLQEQYLRKLLEKDYESKIHKLTMQILSLNSKLEINNISIRQRILTHYYTLKKATLEEMITTGSAPYLIKKRALKILSDEAKFQAMKLESTNLNTTCIKLRTVCEMKARIQEREFLDQDHQLTSALVQHQFLLKEIKSCESRLTNWIHELQETKNSLMLCHKYLEELQRSFLHYRRENYKLNAWKKVQLTKLSKLEIITRKFEDVSEVDFERLEADLRQKAEEMETALQYEKNADLRQKLMEAVQQKKLRQIRRLIDRENRLIEAAKNKIDSLASSEDAGRLDPTHDQAENDYLWEQRCLAAEKKSQQLRAENARLRATLSGDITNAAEWNQAQQQAAAANAAAGTHSTAAAGAANPSISIHPHPPAGGKQLGFRPTPPIRAQKPPTTATHWKR